MIGLDDIFISFVISYISSSIPPLKTLLHDDNSLDMHMQKTYLNALAKWCKNNGVRKSLSVGMFGNIEQLKKYLLQADADTYQGSPKELIECWAKEMRADKVCYDYIQEFKIDDIRQKIDALPDIIQKRIQNQSVVNIIKHGRTKHEPVENYIRRYCTSDRSENNFLLYTLHPSTRYTLTDYVTGVAQLKKNKFILYSSAQTGKTTDLQNLCWELQQSGLYLPVSFEVRLNSNLKREDLPTSNTYDGKEIIVIIDALDEVNGVKRDSLLEEICGYAYENPDTKVVLSCRSNYRRENQLKAFQELYLQELTLDDAYDHINRELGNENRLISLIHENGLYDFAKNPFFLNVLLDEYKRDERKLPKTKAEIYRLFIERSYKNEKTNKAVAQIYQRNLDAAIDLLERIAIALSLMNVQTLSEEEFDCCLGNDERKKEECLRYDLIRYEESGYSFIHNAFREWLVANYLHRNGIEKAKLFATHPNGRIKPEWYNIIMLWVSMYGNDEEKNMKTIIEWLQSVSLELIIYIDKGMINEDSRNAIFKGLMLEYKSLGIRMSSIFTQDYKNLLDFGQSEDTVRFIKDELTTSSTNTAYFADLMCLCFFLNWQLLKCTSPLLLEELLIILDSKMNEELQKSIPSNDLAYIYLENPFFAEEKYVDRYYTIIKSSDHYDAISAMIGLITDVGLSDKYIDYILTKEIHVHNQLDGYTTHIVSRRVIYKALGEAITYDSIVKLLQHDFRKPLLFYSNEWEEYLQMMSNVISRVVVFIKQKKEELVPILENYYLKLFSKHDYCHDRDVNHQDLLMIIRECYQTTGLAETLKANFHTKIRTLFEDGKSDCEESDCEECIRQFALTGIWMTKGDVKADFEVFDSDNSHDKMLASWYNQCPYTEVASFADQCFKEKFPELPSITNARQRWINNFNDFINYDVFKQSVLEITSKLNGSTTRKEYIRCFRDEQDGFNNYIFRFISQYTDQNETYIIDDIIKGIKNEEVYECFFMSEIANRIFNNTDSSLLNDELKKRCFACAKSVVERFSRKEYPVYYIEEAIKLLLNGFFEVEENILINLLDYSFINISKSTQQNYCICYTLFDYMVERISIEVLGPEVIKSLKRNISNANYHSACSYAHYILENRIQGGSDILLEYVISGDKAANNIVELLIKSECKIEELKAASKNFTISDQLYLYELMKRYKNNEEWIKRQLEPVYKNFDAYKQRQAAQLLVSVGSIDALGFVVLHPELLNNEREFHFCYTSPDAINQLCYLIQLLDNKGAFVLNSVFYSLENIATKNLDALTEVKQQLRNLTNKDDCFKYLNRYIIASENKFYTNNTGINDIKQVIGIIDCKNTPIEVKQQQKNGESADNEETIVYVSYNWEAQSDHIVDYFCFVLGAKKIPYKRDKRDCEYLDNIKEFMNTIGAGKKVVVVLSRPYLKSKNCMYELSGVMKDPKFKNRLLPVVVDDTIRDSHFYLELVKHWKDKKEEQENIVSELTAIDQNMVEPEQTKLTEIETIYGLLKEIKQYIDWTNAESLDSLSCTQFKSIIDRIRE